MEFAAHCRDQLCAGVFLRYFLRVLCGAAAACAQRNLGCCFDLADGAAADGVWVFFAADFWRQTPIGTVFDAIWYPVCHDLVRRHFGSGICLISAHVSARGAFEAFDPNLAYAGKTLGLSNTYIFWRIRMPACRQGILAGTVLTFARALGEYGATSMLIGYTPRKTATISTTVYQLWRTNDSAGAWKWVLVNLAISTVVLLAVNLLESKQKKAVKA